MRTTGIKRLVEDVLETMPKPYSEDIVDEVFYAIEQRADWKQGYDALARDLGRKVVGVRGGFWIASLIGKTGTEQVSAAKSSLIDSYVKLTKTAEKRGKKLKEPDALKVMSDYYRENRAQLPSSISQHRDAIVEILMAGYPVDQAFAKAAAREL